jgi:hypothetical protein
LIERPPRATEVAVTLSETTSRTVVGCEGVETVDSLQMVPRPPVVAVALVFTDTIGANGFGFHGSTNVLGSTIGGGFQLPYTAVVP